MLREIEMIIGEQEDEIDELLKDFEIINNTKIQLNDEQILWKIIVTAEESSGILDKLESKLTFRSDFQLNVFQVEASLPRSDEKNDDKEEKSKTEDGKEDEKNSKTTSALSRMELYTDIQSASVLSWPFVLLVLLSAIVASSGLLKDNVPVIVGAMVIAPLLGPNMGLALSVTIGDLELGKKAIKTNFVGIALAFGVSVLIGALVPTNPMSQEIMIRTAVGWGDIVLALAAGAAGSLAFTTGISGAVIGVMIAVALLPPLNVSGILLGNGELIPALGAFLLFASNIICINLAAIVTFNSQGIKPVNWWDEEKAEKALRISYIIWVLMFLLLIYLVYLGVPSL
ncbi:MAG: TIGR00341 family protein [Bacillota bacterium]